MSPLQEEEEDDDDLTNIKSVAYYLWILLFDSLQDDHALLQKIRNKIILHYKEIHGLPYHSLQAKATLQCDLCEMCEMYGRSIS